MIAHQPLAVVVVKRILPAAILVVLTAVVLQIYAASLLERRLVNDLLAADSQRVVSDYEGLIDTALYQVKTASENSFMANALFDISGSDLYLPLFLRSISVLGKNDVSLRLVDFRGQGLLATVLGEQMKFPELGLWKDTVLDAGETWQQLSVDGLYIAQPVLIRDLVEGALLVHLPLDSIRVVVPRLNGEFEHVIATQDGVVLRSSLESRWPVGERLKGFDSDWTWSVDVQSRYGFKVYSLNPKPTMLSSFERLAPLVLLSLVILLVSATLILSFSVRKVLSTLSALSKAIDDTQGSSNLSARVDNQNSPKELAELGNRFNVMMSKLQETTLSRDDIDSILMSMSQTVIVCNLQWKIMQSNRAVGSNAAINDILKLNPNHEFYDVDSDGREYEQRLENKTLLWRKSALIVNGEQTGWVFTAGDVSEIVSAKERLRVLEAAINNATNGFIIADATKLGRPLISANKGFLDITGFELDEVIGQPCKFIQGEGTQPEVVEEIATKLNNEEAVEVDILNYRKNGEPFWNHLLIDPVRNSYGQVTHFLGVVQDITKMIHSREELKLAIERAEAAAKTKSEFLASMSHEIRTPMNGVLGMLGLILDGELSDEQRRRANIAENSAKSLLSIINDILDFTKIEAGQLVFEKINFDLHQLVNECSEALGFAIKQKGLEFIVDTSGIQDATVCGDPGRIRQVLTNLIANATKFTDEGEIMVQVSQVEDGDRWRVIGRVIDSGKGISEEKLGNIFSVFSQEDSSTTRRYGGTGLGLAIVKDLCEKMNGSVRAMSEVGRGSVFEFEVMVDKTDQAISTLTSIDITNQRVLIVDDNQTNLDVLRSQLQKMGADVTEALGPEEALALCQRRIVNDPSSFFDFAILDMKMPTMSGEELGRRIKAHPDFKTMKLIMMTSINTFEDKQKLAKIGFQAYFPKPVIVSELHAALSLIAEGGQALEMATPLITSEYINTLKAEDKTIGLQKDSETGSRVLIADDNDINLLVISGMLQPYNLEIDTVKNGQEALDKLQSSQDSYDMVFMDCQMPIMDGYQATKAIRKGETGDVNKAIPIIAMTANAMKGARDECLQAGMNDYISKPLSTEALDAVLKQWLSVEKEPLERAEGTDQPAHSNDVVQGQVMPAESNQPAKDPRHFIWNKAEALSRVMGDEDRLAQLVTMYLDGSQNRVLELTQAVTSRDIGLARKQVHAINGIAANLSLVSIHHIMVKLEAALRNGNAEQARDWLDQFLKAEHAAIAELSSTKNSSENSTKPERLPVERSEALSQLLVLKQKLENDEFVDLNDFSFLSDGNLDESKVRLHESLKRQLLQFDSESALNTVETLIQNHGEGSLNQAAVESP